MNIRASGVIPAALVAALSAGCTVQVDNQGYIEREDRRFTVDGVADLDVSTFEGAVEIRSWDRPEIEVGIEKRAQDKDVVAKIQVTADQRGNTVSVGVRYSGSSTYIGIGVFTSPRARLIVNVPRETNITARTRDGNIVIDRVTGRLDLRTGDGTVRATETGGSLFVESGDGSLRLEDVTGVVEARTDDGTIRVTGTPTSLQVRSGDGAVVIRVRRGVVMSSDWLITTRDGSIVAELADDLHALVEAEPGSGDRVRSDLALADVTGGTRDQRTLRGRLGNGGRLIALRSGDGSIRLTNY